MNRLLQFLAKRPVVITIMVCVIMFLLTGVTSNTPFFNGYTIVNLVQKFAPLGIVAVGITFVILTGGIDLSVGSVVGWTTLLVAFLVQPDKGPWHILHNWNPFLAMATIVVLATLIGALTGAMIQYLGIPPFLITLAFLFLYRGWALVVTTEEIRVENPQVAALSSYQFSLHGIDTIPVPLYLYTLGMGAVVALGTWLARYTGFGRSVYAIGGSENSAILMGLPVARSKVIVYALSGFCAALGGLVFFIRDSTGSALKTRGMELDAIAVTVIGGTLLTGGVGGVPGTLIGLVTYGIIQTAMSRHSFPTGVDRIVIGALLLAFVLLQKLLQRKAA